MLFQRRQFWDNFPKWGISTKGGIFIDFRRRHLLQLSHQLIIASEDSSNVWRRIYSIWNMDFFWPTLSIVNCWSNSRTAKSYSSSQFRGDRDILVNNRLMHESMNIILFCLTWTFCTLRMQELTRIWIWSFFWWVVEVTHSWSGVWEFADFWNCVDSTVAAAPV